MEITDKDEIQYLNFLHDKSCKIRGTIIDHATTIEMILSDILASYLGIENKMAICDSIGFKTNNSNFSANIKSLSDIFKTDSTNFDFLFPSLIEDLEMIRKIRNKIAHSVHDTTDEYTNHRYTDRVQFNIINEKGERGDLLITDEDYK